MKTTTADRINEIRGSMSQSEFAKSINSSQPVICKILNGEQPSMNVLIDISKKYHVSVDWLLGLSPHKYVSGFSQFDNDDPITYGDAISFLVSLMKLNSISFSRIDSEENSYYSYIQGNDTSTDVLTVNDHFIGDLLLSANTILSTSPETIESWKKKILDDYYIPLKNWGQREEITYSTNKKFHSSLEILRDILDE